MNHAESRGVMPLRPVILGSLVACLLVAVAPWLSGGQEPLAMMTSGGVLLLGALLVWRQPEVRRLKSGPLVWVWAAFMGFAVLSLLWTANRYSTGLWLVQWLMAGLAFWLAYIVAGEKKGRDWLIRGYLLSAAVFCVAAIWMYLTGEYDRLTGTFYWANPAAAYLIPAIILGIDRWRRGSAKFRYWWVAASVLFLASFLLTDSRAATLVLGLVTLLYLLLAETNKHFWITFVFTVAIGFGLSVGLVKAGTLVVQHSSKVVPGSRLAEAAKGESRSMSDRLYFLGSAFEMWFKHPVGGVGAGAYGDVHPQYQQRVVSASTSAHNVYAQVLAELGLMGAVLLAGVLLWLGVGVLRGFMAEPETFAVIVGAVGLLLHFGLDIDARYPTLLVLVAVLLGLVWRQYSQIRRAGSWRGAAVAGLIMLPLISLYQSDVWTQRAKVDQQDGDFGMAAEHFGAAGRGMLYNPDVVNAEGINWYTMGLVNTKEAPPLDRALELARRTQAMDRFDGQHHQLEGRVLMAKGDVVGAQKAFREALRLDPYNHPDYALDLAGAQVAAGDSGGAMQTARAMLAQYPEDVVANRSNDPTVRPALANLEALVGNLHLQLGKLDEAEAAARRALKLQADNLRGRALLRQAELRQDEAKRQAEAVPATGVSGASD